MKQPRLVLALAAAALAVTSVGCGSGGGGASSNQNALSEGRAGLAAMASGGQSASAQKLESILALYRQALDNDPNSSEAHFGAAVCLAGALSNELDGGAPGQTVPPGGAGGGGGGVPMPPEPPALAVGQAGAATAAIAAPENFLAPTDSTGIIPPAPPGEPTRPEPVPPYRKTGLFWNLEQSLARPHALLSMLAPIADLRGGIAPYYGYSGDNAARRLKVLEGLNEVVQHLEKVEADSGFSVTMPLPGRPDQTVTVGLPEVHLFDAHVNSLRAQLALSLAYIRDPGTNWHPPVTIMAGAAGDAPSVSIGDLTFPLPRPSWPGVDKNKDGKLSPDEYMPPSPYLTLRDAALLQTAKQAMLAVAAKGRLGVDGVLARSTDGKFLVPNSPRVRASLTRIKESILPAIEKAAAGPSTLEFTVWVPKLGLDNVINLRGLFDLKPGRPEASAPPTAGQTMPSIWPEFEEKKVQVAFNLAAWFANPPADLKAFAPTLTLNANGWPDPSKTVYPDPTFGGLFPNGLTHDLPF